MSGRLLSFSQYLGGADNVKVVEMFPDDQRAYTYNFANADVSSYTFSADYQSILLSDVTYNNITGDPSFSNTTVNGYFTNTSNITAGTYINTDNAATGLVTLTIPSQRYTGNVMPNARANVVATVLSFQWETNDTPPQKERHRYCILERFDPKVGRVPGDPANESNFVALP
jgi:hypothetical protein